MIRSQKQAMSYVNEVSVITSEQTTVFSMGFTPATPEERQRHFAKVSEGAASETWFIDTLDGKPSIVLARPIIHFGTLKLYGYLFIYISPDFFSLEQQDISINSSMGLAFIDSFGQTFPLSSFNEDLHSDNVFHDVIDLPNSDVATTYSGSSTDFICYITVPELNWNLVSFVPYSKLLERLKPIAYATILGVVICFFACIIISHSIISSISKPLSKMVEYLGHASAMRFETELTDNAHDELGYLAQSYNKICRQMHDLVLKIEDEQTLKRHAEIKMLQAQINPHFLFNTLDSLRFTALMSNARSVSDGLSALSHILRSSILKKNMFISLKQEIDNISDYIIIQKIRYGETINLNIDLKEPSSNAQVMKLLLQPLVENSIIHGVVEGCPITITLIARVEHGQLIIFIQDDGKGFDLNAKRENDRQTKSIPMSGVGLDNVKERLALEYKDNQSFSIQSIPGQGTSVKITLPYIPLQ